MDINCKGELIDLTTPKVMGILNLTPDSFYDGGTYKDEAHILQQVELMLNKGATFIDLGGYSSRPGAEHISLELELKRILPVLKLLTKKFPKALFSIDTFRSEVAKGCLEIGAAMINDISGGNLDPNMMDVVAQYQIPYVLMHMKGTPQNMKDQIHYDNLLEEILFYFSEKLALAREKRINDIIVDPGFGFAKTLAQNYKLLAQMELFKNLGVPVLVGLSRKSMIYKKLGINAQQALNGTTALHMTALAKGANILRVHDVGAAMECIRLHQALEQEKE